MSEFVRQGVVRDENGNLIIPPTRRPDGTWRKAVRVKEGYIPQDEIPVYRSAGVIIREQKSKFVIPGLTKEDAERLRLERQKQSSQSGTTPSNTATKKKKSKKAKSKQTETQQIPEQKPKLDSKESSLQQTTEGNNCDASNELPATTSDIDRKLRREQKRFLQIEEIERKKQAGEKLNKDQLEKLSHKATVEKLIEDLKALKTN
uniref:WIBG Mago-binding domain-containing protein n=1 Tax=Trichobilharzia regenti TaxID=157069 RepID=A0AA85K258_TRIRE|nr:unnamed protein product [Trichobilharzia regenti]